MSTTDDRIVAMEFDNSRFSRNLADTLKGLQDLTKSLDLTNSTRNLDELKAAGNRFNMANVGSAVEGVSARFTAMATVGIAALAHITTRAIDAGARIAKSLTLDLAMDGFHEYETKIGSIQTILANTARYGTTLPTVEKSLDSLNEYADKTIYNFGEMTKNIGLFTNAGIRVEDATSMIKGFSNAAAASGTTAEGAAGAAYQLSQALSSGTIKLMDWKSLTNVGMGNKNMQEGLVQIAQGMGTISKAGTNAKDVQAHFNESLEKGWLSADVMSKYLRIMAGEMSEAEMKATGLTAAQITAFAAQQKTAQEAAQKVRTLTQLIGTAREAIGSGWAKTAEILFGNFEEATTLFTSISDAIGGFVNKTSDARNNLLEGWDKLGGRKVLIEALGNAFFGLAKMITPVQQAFRTIFPPITAKRLFEMTQNFANLMESIQLSYGTIDKLKRVFSGVFAVFHIAGSILKEVFYLIGGLVGEFRGVGGGALESSAKIGDLLVKLDAFLVKGGALHRFFLHIHYVINGISDVLADVTGAFNSFLYTFKTGFTEDEGTSVEKIALALRKFFGIFTESQSIVDNTMDRVHSRFDGLKITLDRLNVIFDGVRNVLAKTWSYISTWFGELGRNIAASLTPGDFDAAVDLVNVGLLGGIIVLLKKFLKGGLDFDIGGGVFGKVKEALEGVTGTLKAMQTELKAKALMEIAIAMGVLTASIVVLSLIDSGKLTKALVAISVGFGQLIVALELMDKMSIGMGGTANIIGLAIGLELIAGSVVILSGAVAILSALSWEDLAKGLSGVGAMLTMMVGVAKLMEGNTVGMIAAGIGMIGIATGLNILAGAVMLFATMDWGQMAKGLIGITGALLIIGGAMNIMPPGAVLAAGLAMIPLATGLTILGGAVLLFGSMDLGTMGKGLLALAGVLLIISLAVNSMPLTLPLIAAGLILVAVALNMMVPAIAMMGHMDLGTLAKGLGALAIMMTILSIAVNVMGQAAGGAVALVIVAGALMILTKVLTTLGNMGPKELATALIAIAVSLGILAGMSTALSPLIPALLAMGVALTVVGAAFALFGVGAYLIAKAFEAISRSGKVAIEVIIDSIVLLIKALPKMVAALIGALIGSANEFLEAGTLLVKIAGVFLLQVLDTIINLTPKIAQALVGIITAGLALIRAKFPELMATGVLILYQLLVGIRSNIGWVTQMVIDIIVRFLDTLDQNMNRLIDAGIKVLVSFLNGIAERIDDVILAGSNILTAFLKGMADHIVNVVTTAGEILGAFIRAIGQFVGQVFDAGVDVLVKFLAGIGRDIRKVAGAVTSIAIAFINAIAENAVRFANAAGDALVYFLNGMADAIRTHSKEIRDAGVNIATAIISGLTGGLSEKADDVVGMGIGLGKKIVGGFLSGIGAGSPSKIFRHMVKYISQGLGLGFKDITPQTEKDAVWQAERIVNAFEKTLKGIPDLVRNMGDLNPVITPVLNLSQIQSSAKGLQGLLATKALTPSMSVDQARYISRTTDLASKAPEPTQETPTEQTFIQNNYSPKALNTNQIYKNTNSQFARAKEVLGLK